MRRRTPLTIVLAAVAAAGLAACGSSGAATTQAGKNGAAVASATAVAGISAKPVPGASASAGVDGSTGTTDALPGAAPSAGTAPGDNTDGSAPTPAPSASPKKVDRAQFVATPEQLPIEASISPTCVPVGGTAKLTVKTVPRAAIAYVAIYANGKSGAEPPWGEGYGGNDRGNADFRGQWSATWVVSLTAPKGDAHVMLVVGSKGKQRSIDVPFSVGGREAGGCGT